MSSLSKLGNTLILASAIFFMGFCVDTGFSNLSAVTLGTVAPFGIKMAYVMSGTILILGTICSGISIYLEMKKKKLNGRNEDEWIIKNVFQRLH